MTDIDEAMARAVDIGENDVSFVSPVILTIICFIHPHKPQIYHAVHFN